MWRIVLVNNGVKLGVEGSEVLPSLRDLEEQGVSLLELGIPADQSVSRTFRMIRVRSFRS